MEWLEKILEEAKSKEEILQMAQEEIEKKYRKIEDIHVEKEQAEEKYAAMEEKYKLQTEKLQMELQKNRKESAVKEAILMARGKNPKAIQALIDMEKVTLQEDGSLEGLNLEELQKTDGYLFEKAPVKIEGTGLEKGVVSQEEKDPSKMDYDSYRMWRKMY